MKGKSRTYHFKITITPEMGKEVDTTLKVSKWLKRFKHEMSKMNTMIVELKELSNEANNSQEDN